MIFIDYEWLKFTKRHFEHFLTLFFRRNLSRAVTLLEMIKRREKTKREHVHLGIEIFEKRYQAKDFNGYLLAEYTNNAMKNTRFATFSYKKYAYQSNKKTKHINQIPYTHTNTKMTV